MTSLSAALCAVCLCDTAQTVSSLFYCTDCQMIHCNAWLVEWYSVHQHQHAFMVLKHIFVHNLLIIYSFCVGLISQTKSS